MPDKLGIYIHVPFCDGGKCAYCDFYSVPTASKLTEQYAEAVCADIVRSAPKALDRVVDTVYFGGGTPSAVPDGITKILETVQANYVLEKDAEVTLEANPRSSIYDRLKKFREAGFNRISIGMQSAVDSELSVLGRRHSREDIAATVADARRAGFDNLSLDLMLCIPGQTPDSLSYSIDCAASLHPEHLSAYILKIEEGTPFYNRRKSLVLPDDDVQADFYLNTCEKLEQHGYSQYEISNFSKPGRHSRHNLRYWDCREYLGFGPGAHGFYHGQRYHYGRSLSGYISGATPLCDGEGGGFEEYVMLRLRLKDGLKDQELRERYGKGLEVFDRYKLNALMSAGLIRTEPGRVSLTRQGFLVSNAVICEFLF